MSGGAKTWQCLPLCSVNRIVRGGVYVRAIVGRCDLREVRQVTVVSRFARSQHIGISEHGTFLDGALGPLAGVHMGSPVAFGEEVEWNLSELSSVGKT